jgi:hypothetical protein
MSRLFGLVLLGFQSFSRFFFGVAVSFATPFMAWIINSALYLLGLF